MKLSSSVNLMLAAVILPLTGCDFPLAGKFRSQLQQPEHFFHFTRGADGCTLRFLEPMIPRASLPALGIGGINAGPGDASVPYGLSVNDASERAAKVTFRFAGDSLESVILPPLLFELLGPANLEGILRVAGGADMTGWKMNPITPVKVQAVLSAAGFTYDPQAESVVVKLRSTAPDARSLVVTLKHAAPAADYKDINLSFRK